MRTVVEQKFFKVAPADYMPVKVGEGAWSRSLTTFSFSGDDFSNLGIIGAGSNAARQAMADTQVDAINVAQVPWAKSISWSILIFKKLHALEIGI